MAIKKHYENDHGTVVEYWNIGSIHEDFKGGGIELTVYGYLDEQARRAGKNPPEAKKYHISGEEYSTDVTRAIMYSYIKQKPEFEGAEDA